MATARESINNIFKKITLSLGSLFIFLLLIEGILRIVDFNPFGEFFENEGRAIFIKPSDNPDRIYEAKPNTSGIGWGTEISINSLGFRGKEYSLTKAKNTYRIIVLGDSIAFGNNLPPDENFSALLEKKYALAGKKIEVLNLSLGGYDTLQEVATLNDIGLALKPDMVILAYCINDIGVASGNANYVHRLQNYGSILYYSRLAQFVRVNLDRIELIHYTEQANSSKQFNETYKNALADISDDIFLTKKMHNLAEQLQASPQKYPFTYDYTDAAHIQRLRYALEKLKKLQGQHGFEVSTIIIPFLQENKKNQHLYRVVYEIVQHEMLRLDFKVLDIYPDFSRAGLQSLLLRQDDGVHPNKAGHEIIANTIYRAIDVH